MNCRTLENYLNAESITLSWSIISGGGTTMDGGAWNYVNACYIQLRNAKIAFTLNKNYLFSLIGMSPVPFCLNGSNLFNIAPVMHKQYPGIHPETTGTYNSSAGNCEPYPGTIIVNIGSSLNF